MAAQNLPLRGLSGKLAFWMVSFVLISELALMGWVKVSNQDRSLQSLQQQASTNGAFISQMNLPASKVLADRLSTVLDLQAGFYSPDHPGDWPPALQEMVARLAMAEGAAAGRAAGFEVASAPLLQNGAARLVLIRPLPDFGPGVLIPMLIIALVCGGLAIVLARGIVRPLGALTRWLPNLDVEEQNAPEPLPASLLDRQDEIGVLAGTLNQTAHRLRNEQNLRRQSERLATLGRIATSLAHEIKNPVAAIGLHANVLKDELASAHWPAIDLIREEVDRITDLVNQWLYVVRTKPGKRTRHDLGTLLQSVGERMAPVFEHAKVKLEMELGRGGWMDVDAPRMEQALRNLLINAVQAMPDGGVVRAAIQRDKDQVEVEIVDQGTGFSDQALKRFREPFFSEREGGMGIGLTLAIEVVEAHGGSIHAGNRTSGCGGRVVVRIPAAEAESL